MTLFYHVQEATNCSKRCTLLIASALKDAFASCQSCKPRPSNNMSGGHDEEEIPISDFDDEQEAIVSAIRNRAMEAKCRRKSNAGMTDSFTSCAGNNSIGELLLIISPPEQERGCAGGGSKQEEEIKEPGGGEEQEVEEFVSSGTHLSCCSCAADSEAFMSVKTHFSRGCPSSGDELVDYFLLLEYQRRSSIIFQCQGWPFGLCRKALLLPPLPKSPSESWSWRKR